MLFILCIYFMSIAAHLASIDEFKDVTINGTQTGLEAFNFSAYGRWTSGSPQSEITGTESSMETLRHNSSLQAANYTITADAQLRGLMFYHIFGFLWAQEVISGIWCCTVAGALCRWYWKFQEDKNHKEFEHMITWMSFKKTLRYFMGSICFGALTIAIVQMMRILFEYFLQQAKQATKNPAMQKCAKFAMGFRAFLLSLQKLVESITMGAYIMVVMQGCSFCVGAKEARSLFKIHSRLIVTTELMATFVLAMARLCIVVTSTLLMFACLETDAALPTMGLLGMKEPEISSPIVPLFVCAAFSWGIANCYVDVVHMTIITLLLSYAADRELNDQTGCYAMTDHLKNFIQGDQNKPFKNIGDKVDPDDKSIPVKKAPKGAGAGKGGGKKNLKGSAVFQSNKPRQKQLV